MTTNVTITKSKPHSVYKALTMQSSYKFMVNKGHRKPLKEIFYFC